MKQVSVLILCLLLASIVDAAAPPESGIDALKKILDGAIDGKHSLASQWCKASEVLAANLYSPRSYRFLGDQSADKEAKGKYLNVFTVRIESSNRSGMAIIKDWMVLISYEERKSGEIGWCLNALLDK